MASTEQRTALAALEKEESAVSTANFAANQARRVFHAAAAGPRLNAMDVPASMSKLTAAAWLPPLHSPAMMKFPLLLQFLAAPSSPSAGAVFL